MSMLGDANVEANIHMATVTREGFVTGVVTLPLFLDFFDFFFFDTILISGESLGGAFAITYLLLLKSIFGGMLELIARI